MSGRARRHSMLRVTHVLGVVLALLVSLGSDVVRIAAGDWIVSSVCCCPSPADCECDPDHREHDASMDACGNSGHATGWELDMVTVPERVELTWCAPRPVLIATVAVVPPAERDLRNLAKPG